MVKGIVCLRISGFDGERDDCARYDMGCVLRDALMLITEDKRGCKC